MLEDYDIVLYDMILSCDNTSTINILNNPVQYFRTKHIDIFHHFIRELVENKTIILEDVATEKQLPDMFTKVLDFGRFVSLRKTLGIYFM